MRRSLLKFLLIIFAPLALMVGVNCYSPQPDTAFHADKCSRYCHDQGCAHTQKASPFIEKIYRANIHWLKHNPLGLSYQAMNLLVYVIAFPLISLALIFGLICRKGGRHE